MSEDVTAEPKMKYLKEDEVSNQMLSDELHKLAKFGMIDFVTDSMPLGEAWMVGMDGRLFRIGSRAEAAAFLTGAHTILKRFAEKQGLM